eukprot:PhF_6_TR13867/c0_g1_i1/m.22249
MTSYDLIRCVTLFKQISQLVPAKNNIPQIRSVVETGLKRDPTGEDIYAALGMLQKSSTWASYCDVAAICGAILPRKRAKEITDTSTHLRSLYASGKFDAAKTVFANVMAEGHQKLDDMALDFVVKSATLARGQVDTWKHLLWQIDMLKRHNRLGALQHRTLGYVCSALARETQWLRVLSLVPLVGAVKRATPQDVGSSRNIFEVFLQCMCMELKSTSQQQLSSLLVSCISQHDKLGFQPTPGLYRWLIRLVSSDIPNYSGVNSLQTLPPNPLTRVVLAAVHTQPRDKWKCTMALVKCMDTHFPSVSPSTFVLHNAVGALGMDSPNPQHLWEQTVKLYSYFRMKNVIPDAFSQRTVLLLSPSKEVCVKICEDILRNNIPVNLRVVDAVCDVFSHVGSWNESLQFVTDFLSVSPPGNMDPHTLLKLVSMASKSSNSEVFDNMMHVVTSTYPPRTWTPVVVHEIFKVKKLNYQWHEALQSCLQLGIQTSVVEAYAFRHFVSQGCKEESVEKIRSLLSTFTFNQWVSFYDTVRYIAPVDSVLQEIVSNACPAHLPLLLKDAPRNAT